MSKPAPRKLCFFAFKEGCEVLSDIIQSSMQAAERAGAAGKLEDVERAAERCFAAQAALEKLIEEQLEARGETAPAMTDAMLA